MKAVEEAAGEGVLHLYVHVEAENSAARRLYHECGFSQEQAEAGSTARMLNRPRRLLLHRSIGG